jgi:hypothetical protein
MRRQSDVFFGERESGQDVRQTNGATRRRRRTRARERTRDAISNAMGRGRRSTIDDRRDARLRAGRRRRRRRRRLTTTRARRGMRTATAVMAVANIVKTSLGPVGLDKARDEDAKALTLRTRREESTKGCARAVRDED